MNAHGGATGIGSSYYGWSGVGYTKGNGTLTEIYGGNVTASADEGAGIGAAGAEQLDKTVANHVLTYTVGKILISGGTVTARGGDKSAGIGSGYHCGYDHNAEQYIKITGGTVEACAGSNFNARKAKSGCAIGCPDLPWINNSDLTKDGCSGRLTIGDNMKVTAGDSKTDISPTRTRHICLNI